VTNDDRLFGYRLQLFDLARRTTVADACRTFGVHRSTFYHPKRRVERHGPEILRPGARRRPKMPNALPAMLEERVLSFAIAHPGLGPRRVASELAREKWGGIRISHASVWRILRRHGLSTRAKRCSLVAGYRAPYEPPRELAERHLEAGRPGELVGVDSFFVGRLQGTEGAVWQLTAIDVASSFAWAELVRCPSGHPTGEQTSKLARRVAGDLAEAGWRLERVLSDNGGEFRNRAFRQAVGRLGARHSLIRAGRPQTNGNVEALHRIILDECWRPAFARYLHLRFTGLRRELETYLDYYNFDRVHHGRLTHGRIPGDVVYGARKMEAR
jgi:transposase InsO family protein